MGNVWRGFKARGACGMWLGLDPTGKNPPVRSWACWGNRAPGIKDIETHGEGFFGELPFILLPAKPAFPSLPEPPGASQTGSGVTQAYLGQLGPVPFSLSRAVSPQNPPVAGDPRSEPCLFLLLIPSRAPKPPQNRGWKGL